MTRTVDRMYVLWMGKIWLMSPELVTLVRNRIVAGLPPDIYTLSAELRMPVHIVKSLPPGAELEPLIER